MNPKIKSSLLFILKFLIAGGIIGSMIYLNRGRLREAASNINYLWMIPVVLLYAFHVLVGAWRWYLLLKVQNIKISFLEALSLNMQGNFFSLVPTGAIGGDAAKAGLLSLRTDKGSKLKGVFTILVDRIIGVISLFMLVGIVGALSIGFLRSLSGAMEMVMYSIIAACTIAAGLVILLFFHRSIEKISLFSWIINICDRYSKGAVHNIMNAMDEFKNQFKVLIFCIFISMIFVHLNLALVLFLIGMATGAYGISFKIYAIAISIGNTAGALPGFPAGLGARDIAVQQILSAGGVQGQATLIPLIFSCIILIFYLSGGIIFVFSRKKKPDDTEQTKADR